MKARRGHFEQDLDLEDWILPVVFAQRESRLDLRPMTAGEQEVFYRRREQVSVAPAVDYGFVGRDLDLHALERLLLIDPERTQVLVRGMAGAGKSTLLAHAGWWWQRTGLIEQVFSFSYEQRAWTAEQITRQIAHELLPAPEFAAWESLGPAARTGLIIDRLRATRHLIVIDNAESITASPAAIPHALPERERDRLARFLSGLRGGRTLVLVGSREAEEWLATSTFAGGVHHLPGLDPQAATALLERIVARHGGSRWLGDTVDDEQRKALSELMRLIDGYPLPMTVIMPQLAGTPPARILAEFGSGGDAVDPSMAARRAIEYSHGKLDPALQKSILLLAPFTGSIPVPVLHIYVNELRAGAGEVNIGEVDLAGAVAELRSVGLARAHPELTGFVETVPILPYFLRNRIRGDPDLERVCRHAHYRLYVDCAAFMQDAVLSGDPYRRALGRVMVKAEYANLMASLHYAQGAGEPVLSVVRALNMYLDVEHQHNVRRALLEQAIERLPEPETADDRWELLDLHNIAGNAALTQGQLDDATYHYQLELDMKRALGLREYEAVTLNQLGKIAQEQRRFAEAKQYFQDSIDISLEHNDRKSAATSYHQLGMVAHEEGGLEVAEDYYRQAADLIRESGARQELAAPYHQLGIIFSDKGEWDRANEFFEQSLAIATEFNDRHKMAFTYHQLGMSAFQQGSLDKAVYYYRLALDIEINSGDRIGAASTYHQLGLVAVAQHRVEQAEQYFQQALDTFVDLGELSGCAVVGFQLGDVICLSGRHDVAFVHFIRSIVAYRLSRGIWAVNVLDRLHEEEGHPIDRTLQQAIADLVPVELRGEFGEAFRQRAATPGRGPADRP